MACWGEDGGQGLPRAFLAQGQPPELPVPLLGRPWAQPHRPLAFLPPSAAQLGLGPPNSSCSLEQTLTAALGREDPSGCPLLTYTVLSRRCRSMDNAKRQPS